MTENNPFDPNRNPNQAPNQGQYQGQGGPVVGPGAQGPYPGQSPPPGGSAVGPGAQYPPPGGPAVGPGGQYPPPAGPASGPGGQGQQPGQYPPPMGGVPMVVEGEFSPEEVRRDKVIAALSYLPLLVLIPIFACVDSQFARRHANQGVLLLLAHFVIWLFYLALYVGIVEDYDTVVTVSVIWVMVESGVMALVLRQIFACLRGEFVAFPLLGKLNLLD